MLRAIADAIASPPKKPTEVWLHQYLLNSRVFDIALTGEAVETDSSEILTPLNLKSLLTQTYLIGVK
jgi:hypothetical protein